MSSSAVSRRVLRKLDVQDVLCPICREIYIEPVSLPCQHDVCLHCLEKTVQNNSLVCPICRKRIGTFLRLAKNLKKIINQPFWEEVKSQFPNEIKKKQKSEDDGLCNNIKTVPLNTSKKGAICHKLEFEELINKLTSDGNKNRITLHETSEKLAKKLQDEEIENDKQHNLINKELEETNFKYIQKHLVSKSPTHPSTSYSDNLENGRDSITSEFTHFTPIYAAPRTPPKVMPNGQYQEVSIIHPKNLSGPFTHTGFTKIQTVKNKNKFKICSNNFSRTKHLIDQEKEIIQEPSTFNNFIKTQEDIQNKIRQEQEDLSLALKLHMKWNERTSTKRRHNYKLRSAKKKK